MKKNKKKSLICLTVAPLLLLTGCSNAADSNESYINNTNSTNSTSTESKEIISTEISNGTDSGISEEIVSGGLYDYYDLLDAEAQKYGIGHGDWIEIDNGKYNYLKGTNMVARVSNAFGEIELFDINTGEWSEIDIPEDDFGTMYYYNGRFYCAHDNYSWYSISTLTFDQDVQSVPANQLTLTLNEDKLTTDENWGNMHKGIDVYINTDGDFILFNETRNKDKSFFCIHWVSGDLEEKKYIDNVTNIETDDGNTIEMNIYGIAGFYKNKLYVGMKPVNKTDDNKEYAGTYILDINTMKLKKVVSEYNGENVSANPYGRTIYIGRYIVYSNLIYDMEDEKVVFYNNDLGYYDRYEKTTIGHDLPGNYYGGKYCIELKDNKWYFVKYPSKGSEVIYDESKSFEIPEDLNDENNEVVALSDKYYLVKNNEGTYIRTYEGGKEGEMALWERSTSSN